MTCRARNALAAAAILAAVVAPVTASAQEPIREDCLPHVSSPSKLKFNAGKHDQWYSRYWNGKCGSLTLLRDQCHQSDPGWNSAIAVILTESTPANSAQVLAKACKLGELVGYEWAKDNNVRCIHSTGHNGNNLVVLRGIVQDAKGGDIMKRLEVAEAKAKTMCASLQPPAPRN